MTALATAPAGRGTRPGRPSVMDRVMAALDTVRDPELDEPVTALGFVASAVGVLRGGRERPLATAHLLLRAQLRVPHGRRRVRRGECGAGRAPGPRSCWTTTSPRPRSTGEWRPGPASSARSATRPPPSWTTCARTSCARPCWPAPTGSARPLLSAGRSPAELAGLRLGDLPGTPELDRLRARRAELGLPAGDDAPLLVDASTGAPVEPDALPLHLRPGPADPGQPRGQRRGVPRHAARPLRGRAGPGRDARRQRDLLPAHSAHRRR